MIGTIQSALIPVLESAKLKGYFTVVALTVAVYDHVLTFNDEVKYIWRGKLNILSSLIIMVRYGTTFICGLVVYSNLRAAEGDQIHVCGGLFIAQAVISCLVTSAADCILAIRVWALYHRNNALLYCLLVLVVVQTVYSIIIPSLYISEVTDYWHFGNHLQGCTPENKISASILHLSDVIYLPNIATAIAMFALTTIRCFGATQRANWKLMPMTAIFLRDGVLWFMCALIALVVQMLLSIYKGNILNVIATPVVVTYSVVSSRILFGMRSLGSRRETYRGRPLTIVVTKQSSTDAMSVG